MKSFIILLASITVATASEGFRRSSMFAYASKQAGGNAGGNTVACDVGMECIGACQEEHSCRDTATCTSGYGHCIVGSLTICHGTCAPINMPSRGNKAKFVLKAGEPLMAASETSEMEVALSAGTELMKFIQSQAKAITDKANSIIENMKDFTQANIIIKSEQMATFKGEIAGATTALEQAIREAQNILKGVKTLSTSAIEVLDMAEDGKTPGLTFELAVQNAKLVYKAALEMASEDLKALVKGVNAAEQRLQIIKATADSYAGALNDAAKGQGTEMANEIKSMRTKAYTTCVASILGGPAAITVCYAVAVGLVETKVSDMQDALTHSHGQLTNMATEFTGIASGAGELARLAKQQSIKLGDIASKLGSNAALTVTAAVLWKITVIPAMKAQLAMIDAYLSDTGV